MTIRPGRSDYALVALLLVVTVLPYLTTGPGPSRLHYAVLGLLQIVPLLARRRAPLLTFAVVTLGCVLQLWLSDQPIPSDIGLFVAYYTVVVRQGWRWRGVAATAVCVTGAVLGGLDWERGSLGSGQLSLSGVAFIAMVNLLCIAVVGALAEAGRRRGELVEQLRARALAAERERDQQVIIAAQTERTRIAREMHDVVAHALAVIVVQADGAGHALARTASPPAIATDALDTIGGTARHALAETRALVGVLRDGQASLELDPTHRLTDLPDVIGRIGGTGKKVHLDTGAVDLAAVPDGIGRAVLRIAQEGLTNSIKHAGPAAQVWVELHADEAGLTLVVTDDGRGPSDAGGGGSGLVGMRERVAAHGGRLFAGARDGRGYQVLAQIPWPAGQRQTERKAR